MEVIYLVSAPVPDGRNGHSKDNSGPRKILIEKKMNNNWLNILLKKYFKFIPIRRE